MLIVQGNTYYYNHLVQQLRVRDDHETVWRLYICLSKSAYQIVSRPDKYRDLIQSIYTFDWNMNRPIVLAFINLIGHMVSSNPIFLIPTLQVLVKNMAPLPTGRPPTGMWQDRMHPIHIRNTPPPHLNMLLCQHYHLCVLR